MTRISTSNVRPENAAKNEDRRQQKRDGERADDGMLQQHQADDNLEDARKQQQDDVAGATSHKSADELGDQLVSMKKEQFNLRFQRANGQAENTGRIRVLRRDIARIQTVINEQRRTAAKA